MLVEFVVGSRPCSKRFFSKYSGFSLSSKANYISKLNSSSIWPLYHEPLAWEIVKALPVLLTLNKIKTFITLLYFKFTGTFWS